MIPLEVKGSQLKAFIPKKLSLVKNMTLLKNIINSTLDSHRKYGCFAENQQTCMSCYMPGLLCSTNNIPTHTHMHAITQIYIDVCS